MANKITCRVDSFYPASESVRGAATGTSMAQIGFEQRLRRHLSGAVLGEEGRESRLINRIGQIRRMVPKMSQCSPEIKQVIRESVAWLEAVGRKCDFSNEDPALWVSRRGGDSRW